MSVELMRERGGDRPSSPVPLRELALLDRSGARVAPEGGEKGVGDPPK